MNTVNLIQDNNWENKYNQKGITVNRNILEQELKMFFNWRTSTKKYKSFIERFRKLGSCDYDNFINHLINKGY